MTTNLSNWTNARANKAKWEQRMLSAIQPPVPHRHVLAVGISVVISAFAILQHVIINQVKNRIFSIF
jgi:hypothetical protein